MVKRMLVSFIMIMLLLMTTAVSSAIASANPVNIVTSPDRLLFNVDNMKPGDWAERTLTVQNRGEADFTYSAVADLKDGSKKLFNELIVTIIEPGDNVLYEGKLSNFDGLEPRALTSQHEEELEFTVEFPAELGNEFQGLEVEVEIKFTAEEVDGDLKPSEDNAGIPVDPSKSDGVILPSTATNTFNLLIIGFIVVIFSTGLYLYNIRKKIF